MNPMIFGALLVFAARVVNVSMATVRTLLSMRGHKGLSILIGFFESLVFILAISRVLQDVGNVWNVLGYCGGFAAGTWLGLELEERLALGYAAVTVISQTSGTVIAADLRAAGYGVTEMVGTGLNGKVQVVTTVARRRDLPAVQRLVQQADEQAFITTDDANRVHRGFIRPSTGIWRASE